MSSWVIDDSYDPSAQQTVAEDSSVPQSKWVLDESQINPAPIEESKLKSSIYAIPRVLKDAAASGLNAVESIPQRYEQAKTEIPGLISLLEENPRDAAKFFTKGVGQTVNNALQAGPALTNYLTNRLHLFPEDWNKHIQRGAKEIDFSEGLNKSFGEPAQPGEALAAGVGRNAIFGKPIAQATGSVLKNTGRILKTGVSIPFNALAGRLSEESIANNLLKTFEKNENSYSNKFNEVIGRANESGHNSLIDLKDQMKNIFDIKKDLLEDEKENLNKFVNNPTLENAHDAKSDLLALQRKYEQKRKRGEHFFGPEKAAKNALNKLIPHIENNMFTSESGVKNTALSDAYRKIQEHYKNHVVPYKGIGLEDYAKGDLLASDLLKKAQSNLKFRARKLSSHSRISQRNALLKVLMPLLGAGAAAGSAYTAYNHLKPEGNQMNVAPPLE